MILQNSHNNSDTICALSTPMGVGGIAVIRVSGSNTFETLTTLFQKDVASMASHSVHLLNYLYNGEIIDEVLLTVFKAPHSYTGEDVAEISCHGSLYIQQRIIETLIECGIRLAQAGEFTLRAFLNKRMDLSQAEAVADLIASNSKGAHDLALSQMRGGFSSKIKNLRSQLVELAALLELELDYSEEDVEFADRKRFKNLIHALLDELSKLAQSFSLGNVIRKGIPVAIVGKPNVGKSTLLNSILNEEKAIVSDIPGTTRDSIEDTFTTHGITFRFIDTAGIRENTADTIENIGISRTFDKIEEAYVVLYLFDINTVTPEEIEEIKEQFSETIHNPAKRFILIGNKTDMLMEYPSFMKTLADIETVFISAKRKENINLIIEHLVKEIRETHITDNAIVSNARHYEAIKHTLADLESAAHGFENNIPTDLIAIDIRSALHHLGEVTGEVTTDEILGTIFSRFCIGK